jgi:zeaxanthin glucosyltransferase
MRAFAITLFAVTAIRVAHAQPQLPPLQAAGRSGAAATICRAASRRRACVADTLGQVGWRVGLRCLFVAFPQPGHLNAMICIAQRLAHDGHDVSFASMEDVSARLAAAGLPPRCDVVRSTAHGVESRRATQGRQLTALLRTPAFAKKWVHYTLMAQVPAQIAGLRELVRARRPDVIVTDPLLYAAAVVAEQEAIPWAAVSILQLALTPPDLRWPYLDALEDPALVAERDHLFAAEGVAPRVELGEVVSPHLFVLFAIDALAPSKRIEHAICVGPMSPLGNRGDEPAFRWERLRDGMPLVYASFGSQLAPEPSVYAALCNALGPDEADVVIAYGDPAQAPEAVPSHVTAVRWAPQLALLDRAAVMVTHGGANSVAECLMRGVPPLVIPLGYDQPLHACLVERAGAGIALAPEHATVERVRAALRELLADGPHRRRARELATAYAGRDGARRAADLIVELSARA